MPPSKIENTLKLFSIELCAIKPGKTPEFGFPELVVSWAGMWIINSFNFPSTYYVNLDLFFEKNKG